MEMFDGTINSVFRMHRFNRSNITREPTKSIKVIIKCDTLPENVTVYGFKCLISPFLQRVKPCFKCHRFGHFDNKCNVAIRKSMKCGQHCEKECSNTINCSSCNKSDHCFGDEKCAVRKMEENILRVQ